MSSEDAYRMMNILNEILEKVNTLDKKVDTLQDDVTEIKKRLSFVEQDVVWKQ